MFASAETTGYPSFKGVLLKPRLIHHDKVDQGEQNPSGKSITKTQIPCFS
jgi:hypothetical protein